MFHVSNSQNQNKRNTFFITTPTLTLKKKSQINTSYEIKNPKKIITQSIINPLRKIHFKLYKDVILKQKNEKNQNKKSKIKLNNNIINSNESYISGRWKKDEHQRFIEAIIKYGNNWSLVQKFVGTRSSTQARSHAQKFFEKLKRNKVLKFNLDFSKNSLKKLQDSVEEMSNGDIKKMIHQLNSITYEKNNNSKKKINCINSCNNKEKYQSKLKSNNFNNDFNCDNDINNFDFKYNDNEQFINNEELDFNEEKISRKNSEFFNRKFSIRDRKSVNSIEAFYENLIDCNDKNYINNNNIIFDDKDYALGFNKAFRNTINDGSRKMSLEDNSFLYKNIN